MSSDLERQQPEAETEFNSEQADAFLKRMVGVLNDAGLALMCSIGHQTGLFDTMADVPPSTSEQIATKANLNERYVREWLGSMVAGGIVKYDPEGRTYRLPPEHAAALTRAAGPDNMAFQLQYIPMMGNVEAGIIHSFRHGGGVPYSQYPRFQKLMAEDSASVQDISLVSQTLPLVPGLPERLRAGGVDVLDVGCGSGHAINLLAREFPGSRFTGADFSPEGIAAAQAEAREMGLSNAQFKVQDVADLGEEAQFDFITAFDTIHDQARPRQVLKAIRTALRPGGVFLMADIYASSNVQENIKHPIGPYLYTVSCMHCMTVSLAQGGEGLGTVWGTQLATALLHEAGFTGVEVKRQPSDVVDCYYICTRD